MTTAADEIFTAERLSALLGRPVAKCEPDEAELEKISQASHMRWATVTFSDADAGKQEQRVVLKVTRQGEQKAMLYGLAREASFYNSWRDLASLLQAPSSLAEGSSPAGGLLGGYIPRVYFAEGDMPTGAKRILMEDLSDWVQAGYFFGGGNPNCWGKDLEQETAKIPGLTAEDVVKLCFSAAAKLHATFWDAASVLKSADGGDSSKWQWLRGAQWLAGEEQASWEASQESVRSFWASCREDIAAAAAAGGGADGGAKAAKIRWDPLMIKLLDAATSKTSWAAFQDWVKPRLKGAGSSSLFTLTHGDFHPANFMLRRPSSPEDAAQLLLLDWEVVGVGSGPQDLGQFMISHVEPALRERVERGAVKGYFEELKELNPGIEMTFDQCWEEYVQGGLGRWMWFVPMLVSACPPKMGQFFHDQVLAFARTHGITKETVPMPRA